MRRPQPHEYRRADGVSRAAPGQPAGHRLADVGRQRQAVAAAALAPDGDLALAPVNVAQLQDRDLPGAQAKPRQQHDDRVIPAAGRAAPVAAIDDPGQVCRADRPRQGRQLPARRRRHRAGQRRGDLPVQVEEAQQRPQAGHRCLRRRHAPAAAFAACESGHVRSGQARHVNLGQETAGHPGIATDAVCGQASFPGQVSGEATDQQVTRSLRLRHPRRRHRQRAQIPHQRHQGPDRQLRRVTISAASSSKLAGNALVQRCRLQPLRLKPAAQVRHQVDLMRR
jgi:hypothetical protein